MIKNWNYLLRTLVYAGVVALAGYGAWHIRAALRARDEALAARDERIAELTRQAADQHRQIKSLTQRVQRLRTALQLLKVDHRVGRIEVLQQRPAPENANELETTLRFVEVDPQGTPVGPAQTMTILGSVAYVDAWVVKFDDRYIEQGDELRGTSLCLFRRLFGEFQQPREGFSLDTVGTRPAAYSVGHEMTPFERRLWQRFWDYANNPSEAHAAGVRAMHGQAVSMQLRPGGVYRLELRASDGLTIRPEDEAAQPDETG